MKITMDAYQRSKNTRNIHGNIDSMEATVRDMKDMKDTKDNTCTYDENDEQVTKK